MTSSIESLVEKQVFRWQSEQNNLKNEMGQGHIPKPVITISRLLGSGASEIGKTVAEHLNCELVGIRIMDEVSKRSHVRKELVDAMDERVRTQIGDWVDKLLHGKTLDSGDQYRYLLEAMNYFMRMGNVVMLGRGAGFAPKTRPRLDVRIVAPTHLREERVMRSHKCSRTEAMYTINENDSHRTQFVKLLFGADWWDAREYDLIINTANVSITGAVSMIENAWKSYAESRQGYYLDSPSFA